MWIDCAGEQAYANTSFHAVSQMFNYSLGWRGDERPEDRVSQLEHALAPSLKPRRSDIS